MKALHRNKKTIHYALYSDKTPIRDSDGCLTGEYTKGYGDIHQMKANVSASRGTNETEQFGQATDYTRTIAIDNPNCPIDEKTIVWVDKPITGKHDYIVVAVARSLNSVTYAIKEVDVT